jgi:hypothetical protein
MIIFDNPIQAALAALTRRNDADPQTQTPRPIRFASGATGAHNPSKAKPCACDGKRRNQR